MAVNSIYNSTLRFTGLASGLDTDAIIDQLMNVEKLKLNRETRARTLVDWKLDALNTAATSVKDFRNKYMSALSADNMLSGTPYNIFKMDVTGNEASAVTMTAGEGAAPGTITINEIKRLASGAKAESEKGISSNSSSGEISGNTKLKDLKLATPLQFEGGKISFAINGETFTFSQDDTLQTMINKVNASESAGVTMGYSQLTDKITIETKETGAKKSDGSVNSLSIRNITGNAFGEDGGAFGIKASSYVNGKDAQLTINGIEVSRSSNNFTIDGISYKLNSVTEPQANIRATLTRDIEGSVEKIKSFVEAYNELIISLDKMVSEKKTNKEKDYTPLTEDEKAAMSEKEVEQWEAIAKKGLLYNDSSIQKMLTELRTALYDSVASAGLSAADIGLKTSSDWSKKGQIELDTESLRTALQKDPDKVMKVFTSFAEDGVDASTAYKQNGLLNRMSDIMYSYIKDTQPTEVNTLNNRATALDTKIYRMETKMYEQQERYYLKYASLESAMSSLTSQSSWLTSMLGNM